ncbi:hypothetical protein [Cohnella sp. GCM10012308]|uniref:hypothetical protein n=1 Tax=Cohnella sp. GCM10012308 TaxID=3317329 RepID=UPI0036105D6B
MKIAYLAGLALLAAAMAWADVKQLKRDKYNRWAYGGVMAVGLVSCSLYMFVPGIPGPTDWIRPWFEPLGKWLAP